METIEKIRISLWDIFTFFLSGILVGAIILWQLFSTDIIEFQEFKAVVLDLSAALSLFLIPIVFTLIGMLLEPVANYFDRHITHRIFQKYFKHKQKHKAEEIVIEDYIKQKCLGALNGKIDKPYSLCKEYVETKQLSTTFMIFLSRYGFYRNASFLAYVCALLTIIQWTNWRDTIPMVILWIGLGTVFKVRAQEFYSYQAPSVYYAFLIDKLEWKS